MKKCQFNWPVDEEPFKSKGIHHHCGLEPDHDPPHRCTYMNCGTEPPQQPLGYHQAS